MEAQQARFSPGELIHHRRFDYRGVVFDVDPHFMGSDEWYEAVALSRPPRDRPWYHVMVDGAGHTTYVAERNLERDTRAEPVHHPLIEIYFSRFDRGRYLPRNRHS